MYFPILPILGLLDGIKVKKTTTLGLHRIEKSLKIKFALISTWKQAKALKSPWILPFAMGFNTDFGGLNQYKIMVPLFGAAYAAPN